MPFGDASYFIGVFDRDDQWHVAAARLAEEVRGKLSITDAAMGEAITMIGSRAGGKAARRMYHLFTEACDITFTTPALFKEAMVFHTQYDGRLSTSDCLTVAAMVAANDTEVLSFDSDFDRVRGIVRLK